MPTRTWQTLIRPFLPGESQNSLSQLSGHRKPRRSKKKADDVTIIKRATPDALRCGAAKGCKVLLVWDKACIDYRRNPGLALSYANKVL
jgi:hypothetical protein